MDFPFIYVVKIEGQEDTLKGMPKESFDGNLLLRSLKIIFTSHESCLVTGIFRDPQ